MTKKKTWRICPIFLRLMEGEFVDLNEPPAERRGHMTFPEYQTLLDRIKRHGARVVGVDKDGYAIRRLNPGWDDHKACLQAAPDNRFMTAHIVRDYRMQLNCFTVKEMERAPPKRNEPQVPMQSHLVASEFRIKKFDKELANLLTWGSKSGLEALNPSEISFDQL